MEPISEEEARQFLEEALVAHIGVVTDGEPYVTPMSFVVDGDRILFRTKPGRRFEGMTDNPKVCIEASRFDEESGDWISVIIIGEAEERNDNETRDRALQLLINKYSKSLGSPLGRGGMQPMAGFPHVVAVSIDEISGMCSGRGFSYRTRPGRL